MIGLSGVSSVIWLEGINDFSKNGNASVEAVQGGMRDGVSRLRAALPGVLAEFVPESTTGGAGDKLHPNRTGYLAMGSAVDLSLLDAPRPKAP